jgi:hypothetical protein
MFGAGEWYPTLGRASSFTGLAQRTLYARPSREWKMRDIEKAVLLKTFDEGKSAAGSGKRWLVADLSPERSAGQPAGKTNDD